MTTPEAQHDHPVILFDGLCNLCTASVRWIIRRDPGAVFRFASLQSAAGRRLREQHGDADDPLQSVILLEHGRRFDRSTAALRIARRLRFPWPLCYGLIVIPRPVRDVLYRVVARYRYRWFGKRDTCMIPTPDVQQRFIE